jgi:hypothetical protein
MLRFFACVMLLLPAFCGRASAADEPKPTSDTATLVEAIQKLAGQQLYQTYKNLDSLVEFRFFGIREAGELAQMIHVCVDSAEEAERQLARVAAMKGLSKADTAAIARLRKTAGLLVEQGKSLQTYWDTGVNDHWKQSETARKAAYAELEEILELNPKKGIAPPPREPGKKAKK